VDHARFAENVRRAGAELEAQTKTAEGGLGVAQSAGNVERREADRAPSAQRVWRAARDDRDVENLEVAGVRQVANRTFYRRAQGWVDVRVANADDPVETVTRWSERFFELLRTTTAEENARLSQEGPLVLEVQGRVLRVVDPRVDPVR
jgi:hypothetical protein